MKGHVLVVLLTIAFAAFISFAGASSHSEAPGTARSPQTDATDFYMFKSYEKSRSKYVTFIANYRPFQTPYGGPNYFALSTNHIYDINIDNDGDSVADQIFSIRPQNKLGGSGNQGLKVLVNSTTDAAAAVPLKFVGRFNNYKDLVLNFKESYQVLYSTAPAGTLKALKNKKKIKGEKSTVFYKPFDNAGTKAIKDYQSYAEQHIYNVKLPSKAGYDCENKQGKVFVGQRRESFAVNLGGIFDLVDFVPLDEANGLPAFIRQDVANSPLRFYSVTSIVLEIPISCLLKNKKNPIIGAWTTARTITTSGSRVVPGSQVSRLGNPLVNELVIGLKYKALFNQGSPSGDAAFLTFVQYPTLPTILDLLFRTSINSILSTNFTTIAPTNYPRNDLVAAFLTGLPGVNQPKNVVGSEMLRLNTALPATPRSKQSTYGVLADDLAGFPNGRRPGDDVVDIALDVIMGALCHTNLGFCTPDQAVGGALLYTDGAPVSSLDFKNKFPYLNEPIPANSPEFGQSVYTGRTTASPSTPLNRRPPFKLINFSS